jgi:hypothetical protein
MFILAQDYSAHDQIMIDIAINSPLCRIFHFEKYNPIRMARVRDDNIKLSRDFSEFVLWIDDDFVFRPGSFLKYDTGVKWLEEHPQCFGIQFDGYQGGYFQKEKFELKFGGIVWTSRGLLLRKLNLENIPRIFHLDCLDVMTNHEESAAVYPAYEEGFYTLKAKNCPTLHRHNKWENGAKWEKIAGDINLGQVYLTKLLGVNYEVRQNFRPSDALWKKYVESAIKRFGFAEGQKIRNERVG